MNSMIGTALRTSLLGVAGAVTVGLIAMGNTTAVSANEDVAKRDEDTPQLVLVDDDDDDDTNDTSRNTGFSRSTGDNTRSNFTRVSRDRDLSRSDKTRDWTWDGGKKKRDWSGKKTNDRSRNDSRG